MWFSTFSCSNDIKINANINIQLIVCWSMCLSIQMLAIANACDGFNSIFSPFFFLILVLLIWRCIYIAAVRKHFECAFFSISFSIFRPLARAIRRAFTIYYNDFNLWSAPFVIVFALFSFFPWNFPLHIAFWDWNNEAVHNPLICYQKLAKIHNLIFFHTKKSLNCC